MTTTHTPSTLLALHEADPEGLLIVALKLMGWASLGYTVCSYHGDTGPLSGHPPATNHLDTNAGPCCPPAYHTSLDAVAELEAGLTETEHDRFQRWLWELAYEEALKEANLSLNQAARRAYISAKPHLRLIAWVLTKQTI